MSAHEVGLYDECSNEEHVAYTMGWNTARAIDRAEAFAAIRRAAAAAREWDALGDHMQAEYAHKIAYEIRNTIRAVIASEASS